MAGLAGLEGLLSFLLQKAEHLADFGEIPIFICEALKTMQIVRVIGNFGFVARLVIVFFNWKPRFHQDEFGTCCLEAFCP